LTRITPGRIERHVKATALLSSLQQPTTSFAMNTSTKPLTELHTENADWIKHLDFYTDEIRIMQSRIAEIESKNTAHDVRGQVEHFQNQLILQRNHVDELRHDIIDHESYIVNRANENPVALEKQRLHDHPVLRGRMQDFEKIFNELRAELNRFLAKFM
jgi:hypothetical protein